MAPAIDKDDPIELDNILKDDKEFYNSTCFYFEIKDKNPLIHYLCKNKKPKVLEYILKRNYKMNNWDKDYHDILINMPNEDKKSALHLAIFFNSKNCLEVLKKAGGTLIKKNDLSMKNRDEIIKEIKENQKEYEEVHEDWLKN